MNISIKRNLFDILPTIALHTIRHIYMPRPPSYHPLPLSKASTHEYRTCVFLSIMDVQCIFVQSSAPSIVLSPVKIASLPEILEKISMPIPRLAAAGLINHIFLSQWFFICCEDPRAHCL